MPKKYIVRLTEEERQELICITRTGKHTARKIIHAKVILEADESSGLRKADKEIADRLGIGASTVERIRTQFVEEGLESALSRKPRTTKKPLKINGEEEAHLVALCCSTPPTGQTRWTLKLLADRLVEMEVMESVSPATVGRALKKTNLSLGRKRSGASLRW